MATAITNVGLNMMRIEIGAIPIPVLGMDTRIAKETNGVVSEANIMDRIHKRGAQIMPRSEAIGADPGEARTKGARNAEKSG